MAVSNVWFELNTNGWAPAFPANAWSNWSANVTLTPGTNVVRAYAVDTSGNVSPTNAVSFFYVVALPMTVDITGRGAVSPNYSNQLLVIGSNYTMTAAATPGSGFAFTNWTGGTNLPLALVTNGAAVKFAMETNLILQANFVDVQPPTNTITAPTAGQRWSNSTLTVTGTARDNVAVSNVWFELNADGWTPAFPANAWSNWTANVTLTPGTNVVRAYAVDTSGNVSPTNAVSFFYVVALPMTVDITGRGAVTPNDSNQLLAIGTNYSLTANPSPRWLFSNWVASGSENFVSNSQVLSFTMQSNLTLTANFVTNLFIAMAGRYDGIFYISDSEGATEATLGLIENLLLGTNGVYSGKMYLAGTTNALTGAFNTSGQVTEMVGTGGGNVTLQLNIISTTSPRQITGQVQGTNLGGWASSNLNLFAATTNTNNFPNYTVLLTQDTNVAGAPADYGYVLITNTGSAINLGGVLSDGAPFSRSEPINEENEFPVYANLYGGRGLLLGRWSLSAGISAPVPQAA